MDGMTQFPSPDGKAVEEPRQNQDQSPEPRPSVELIYTPPPLLPEPKKRIWPLVLLSVVGAVALILSFLVYYGAPVPEETSDLGANLDLANIGSELNQVEINNLDSELKDIENELQ